MKRNMSNHSNRDEKLRISRSENYETGLRRTEEERLQRRRKWIIEQKMLREHERLKKKKILEYEIRRALEKGLLLPRRFPHHSCSKSKSKSPENRHKTVVTSSTSNTSILSKKLKPSDGTMPLLKGPEGAQVSATELQRIKVDIQINVPDKTATRSDDLQRDIINPEDIVVKRREGEGSKPIFEREEIKSATDKTEEIKSATDKTEEIKSATDKTEEIAERRTVIVINNENLENKSEANKKYTTSSRSRSHSPRYRSSHHIRYENSKHNNKDSYGNDRNRDHSRGGSREYKEKVRQHVKEEHLRERKSYRYNSHSREREQKAWARDSCHSNRSFKDERPYREKSRERSQERRERDKFRGHRVPASHYIEQIPVPVYYGDFPPRPIMVGPLVPIRGPVPPLGGTRHMMGPLRPFPPRFIQPVTYRFCPPLNPRFRPMYQWRSRSSLT